MNNNVRSSISKRLSRTILLLAVPLFVLSLGTFYQYAHELLHKEAIERSSIILSTTTQQVCNYLSKIETAAKSNVWMLENNFTPDSLPVISHRIVELNGSVLSCSVAAEPNTFPQYGENFSVYSVDDGDTVRTELESEFEYYEKNWYKKTIQTGAPCWINPFSDFNEGIINQKYAVGSYCIPLRPHGNRIEGVVSVDFSFEKLRETILATNHPYPSSYYMIVGPGGGYLVHPDNNLPFKKTIFTATDSVKHSNIIKLGREMTAGKRGMMHVTFDDGLCHVNYMPIADTKWSIALVCHDDDVLADYNYLTLAMIIIVIVGLVIVVWITRKVVQRNIGPLNELLAATKSISEGKYHAMMPESKHKDVIGKLQNAFRNMQVAIVSNLSDMENTEVEIKEENLELERMLPIAREASKRRQKFIQNVSTHISRPINIISGLTLELKDFISRRNNPAGQKDSGSEKISNLILSMKHQSSQLRRNILMLYDISDKGSANTSRYLKNDVLSCNELARECIKQALTEYPTVDILLETDVPNTLFIKTNRLYLLRTVTEVLYNAAKYSDGQHITLRVQQTRTTIQFVIEDVGPGLPKDSEELFFLPFTKVDELSEGLGLGLPLIKGHMEMLGGIVVYDNSYKYGCRIIVQVPKS